MAVTKTSLLVGLLAFLCLSLGSANRILKNNDGENQLIGDGVPSGKENHQQNSSHTELKSIPTGSMPKISSIGPINGDCCSYDTNCGGYSCSTCGCGGGGSSSCQSCSTCSSCQWQGCHGCQEWQGCHVCPECQGCQGCQTCQGCQSCGCQASMDDSKVKQDSIQTGEPEPPVVTLVPPVKPTDHDIKSSGGSNLDIKSNGGLV